MRSSGGVACKKKKNSKFHDGNHGKIECTVFIGECFELDFIPPAPPWD
jgi:hypothetical protein